VDAAAAAAAELRRVIQSLRESCLEGDDTDGGVVVGS